LIGIFCLFFFFPHHSATFQLLGCGSATKIEIAFAALNAITLHRMLFPTEMEKPVTGETLHFVIPEGRGNTSGFSVFTSGIRALPGFSREKERRINLIACHIEVWYSYLSDGVIYFCLES